MFDNVIERKLFKLWHHVKETRGGIQEILPITDMRTHCGMT